MIQLTKTQHRAMNAFMEDRSKAEAGMEEVLREAGVKEGDQFDYNPILGTLTPKPLPTLESVVEDAGGKIVGELDKPV